MRPAESPDPMEARTRRDRRRRRRPREGVYRSRCRDTRLKCAKQVQTRPNGDSRPQSCVRLHSTSNRRYSRIACSRLLKLNHPRPGGLIDRICAARSNDRRTSENRRCVAGAERPPCRARAPGANMRWSSLTAGSSSHLIRAAPARRNARSFAPPLNRNTHSGNHRSTARAASRAAKAAACPPRGAEAPAAPGRMAGPR